MRGVEKYFRVTEKGNFPPGLRRTMKRLGVGEFDWDGDEPDPYNGGDYGDVLVVLVRGLKPTKPDRKIDEYPNWFGDDDDDSALTIGTFTFELAQQLNCCGALVLSEMSYNHLTPKQASLTFNVLLREFTAHAMEREWGDILIATTIPEQKQFETLLAGAKFRKVLCSKNPRTRKLITTWVKDLLSDKLMLSGGG